MSHIKRKPDFHMQKQRRRSAVQISCVVTSQLIRPLFVQTCYFLNPKFQASGHLLWLHSSVCVEPSRKLQRPVFSQCDSIYIPDLSLSLSSVISPDIQVMTMLRRHKAVITDIVRKTFRKHHSVQELLSLCSIGFTVFFLLKIKQSIVSYLPSKVSDR